MKRLLTSLFIIAAICFALVPVQAVTQDEEIESYTRVGQQMPSFTIKTLDGSEFSIDALKGKVVLVTFWATWCAPCLAEMPRLEKQIWRTLKSDDFVMVAIAREQTDDEILAFRKKQGLTFPMASDPRREIFKLFGNGGIPRNYVAGADGKILYQSDGYAPAEFSKMKALIESELKKERVAKLST